MGRFLDLLCDPRDGESAQLRQRDKSDKSDQSHATIEDRAETHVNGGVWSLRSLWSHCQPGDTQSPAFDPDPDEKPLVATDKDESAPPAAAVIERAVASWGEAEEERAAIVEYDGDIPRAWAEGFARLDPDRPPGDVPLLRWQRFVDDVGLFFESPFCAVAAALGWGPYDLFGCDRDRPFARIDQKGLLWSLNGDRLVMLAADAATIEFSTGARQTWRRNPASPGRVLAWELAG